MLDQLQGYRTKIAAVVIGLLAANEVWHFLPDQYVQTILYLASGAGLYFLREAVESFKGKVDQMPQQTAPAMAPPMGLPPFPTQQGKP